MPKVTVKQVNIITRKQALVKVVHKLKTQKELQICKEIVTAKPTIIGLIVTRNVLLKMLIISESRIRTLLNIKSSTDYLLYSLILSIFTSSIILIFIFIFYYYKEWSIYLYLEFSNFFFKQTPNSYIKHPLLSPFFVAFLW